MKTFSLSLLSAAVVTVALATNVALGASLLFTAGFAAIVVTDYTRAARRLKLPATMAVGARRERFGLAA